jgi:hypothetical protein
LAVLAAACPTGPPATPTGVANAADFLNMTHLRSMMADQNRRDRSRLLGRWLEMTLCFEFSRSARYVSLAAALARLLKQLKRCENMGR